MNTPSPTPRPGASTAGGDPGTRSAGAISLAAALAGMLLGASSALPRSSSTSSVRQGAVRVAGLDR